MNNDITALKKAWQSIETDPESDLREFHQTLLHWRRRKKRTVFFWSIAVILFSIICFGYVIYTDQLNSVSKSISEIILLLISIYLFTYSWQRINSERKEYVSSSIDFMETLPRIHSQRNRRELIIYCTSTSLFLIAIFLYCFDFIEHSSYLIGFALAALMILIFTIWVIVKPWFWRRLKIKNQVLSAKITKILKYS